MDALRNMLGQIPTGADEVKQLRLQGELNKANKWLSGLQNPMSAGTPDLDAMLNAVQQRKSNIEQSLKSLRPITLQSATNAILGGGRKALPYAAGAGALGLGAYGLSKLLNKESSADEYAQIQSLCQNFIDNLKC
jgi:hypothetical protein